MGQGIIDFHAGDLGYLVRKPNITRVQIIENIQDLANSTDMKGISQDFSDGGLHNSKYRKNQPIENCGLRA